MALAAYNAGEGNVDKYGDSSPFRETQDYVRRVTSRYQNLYSSGVGLSSLTNSSISAQAINQPAIPHVLLTQVSASLLSILLRAKSLHLPDGTYTDAPTGTYVTNNATAIAHIRIESALKASYLTVIYLAGPIVKKL